MDTPTPPPATANTKSRGKALETRVGREWKGREGKESVELELTVRDRSYDPVHRDRSIQQHLRRHGLLSHEVSVEEA